MHCRPHLPPCCVANQVKATLPLSERCALVKLVSLYRDALSMRVVVMVMRVVFFWGGGAADKPGATMACS